MMIGNFVAYEVLDGPEAIDHEMASFSSECPKGRS